MVRHIDLWDEYTTGPAATPEVLGVGLNGPVIKIYSKRDPSMSYALKEIRIVAPQVDSTGPSTSALVGFVLNELQVCLRLDHANIARVFEVYESPTSVFLVMELCAGGELYGKLRSVGRFNEIETIFLISQMIKAVSYMHTLDIVHGDLKLENFIFAKDGAGGSVFKTPLKLIDFGFSHLGSERRPKKMLCGSPQYMAPEKFSRSALETTKSDMWSIGVITFMLLTGKAPFAASTLEGIGEYYRGATNIQGPVRKALEKYGISSDGIDFVLKLVEKDIDARLSARDALNHRWLAGMEVRRTHSRLNVVADMRKCLELLIDFAQLGALRRACIGLVAMYGPPLVTVSTIPAVFDAIDHNNDGFIQLEELESVLEQMGLDASRGPIIFENVDLVGDGRINFSEFIAATDVFVTIRSQPNSLPSSYIAIIESIFRKLDVDNSGTISDENLFSLFGRKGYKGTRTTDLIKEGDFAGDGVISLDEFFNLVKYGGGAEKRISRSS